MPMQNRCEHIHVRYVPRHPWRGHFCIGKMASARAGVVEYAVFAASELGPRAGWGGAQGFSGAYPVSLGQISLGHQA
ncbi:hypothetical protein [Aliidiomarina shirensis]|uniref:hypothetical protein n=1 Tax=Aliidiomarina shirensis TaxID=1048642 RepID=UPI000F875D79|nr:hypothetical protein [Aliidiomarina shirensis]